MSQNKEIDVYQLVREGAIANPNLGEGRIIPSLIISGENENYLKEIIRRHEDVISGDVKVAWLKSKIDISYLALRVIFTKPIEYKFKIVFVVPRDYVVIQGIVKSRAIYLQVGNSRDRVSEMKLDSIVMEIPYTGFDEPWKKILDKTLSRMAKKEKLPKKARKELIKVQKEKLRAFWNIQSTKGNNEK